MFRHNNTCYTFMIESFQIFLLFVNLPNYYNFQNDNHVSLKIKNSKNYFAKNALAESRKNIIIQHKNYLLFLKRKNI